MKTLYMDNHTGRAQLGFTSDDPTDIGNIEAIRKYMLDNGMPQDYTDIYCAVLPLLLEQVRNSMAKGQNPGVPIGAIVDATCNAVHVLAIGDPEKHNTLAQYVTIVAHAEAQMNKTLMRYVDTSAGMYDKLDPTTPPS